MKTKEAVNYLIQEIYECDEVIKPKSEYFKTYFKGYKQAIIFAIDNIIDGKKLPYKTKDFIITKFKDKEFRYFKNK